MGLLRFFLALCVLNQHISFWDLDKDVGPFLHGYAAVCVFFTISGFYMSMILSESYQGRGGVVRFYSNRALRLLPTYWIVLGLTVYANYDDLIGLAPGSNVYPNSFMPQYAGDLYDRIADILCQLFLLPSAAMVTATAEYYPPDGLIAGQMLSVGVEFMFYAIAPLLVLVRGRALFVLLPVLFALHYAPHFFALPERPWQYEMAPCVLIFFALGHFAYQYRDALSPTKKSLGWLALPIIFLYSLLIHDSLMDDFTNSFESAVLYIGAALLIPSLFQASKSAKIDRYLGDLSYPIYVCHMLVYVFGYFSMNFRGHPDQLLAHRIEVGVTILFSMALLQLVEKPIEHIRAALRDKKGRKSKPVREVSADTVEAILAGEEARGMATVGAEADR